MVTLKVISHEIAPTARPQMLVQGALKCAEKTHCFQRPVHRHFTIHASIILVSFDSGEPKLKIVVCIGDHKNNISQDRAHCVLKTSIELLATAGLPYKTRIGDHCVPPKCSLDRVFLAMRWRRRTSRGYRSVGEGKPYHGLCCDPIPATIAFGVIPIALNHEPTALYNSTS